MVKLFYNLVEMYTKLIVNYSESISISKYNIYTWFITSSQLR